MITTKCYSKTRLNRQALQESICKEFFSYKRKSYKNFVHNFFEISWWITTLSEKKEKIYYFCLRFLPDWRRGCWVLTAGLPDNGRESIISSDTLLLAATDTSSAKSLSSGTGGLAFLLLDFCKRKEHVQQKESMNQEYKIMEVACSVRLVRQLWRFLCTSLFMWGRF